ncbi:MAG: UDP-glucose 4-epimerase GalE [Crocosphaera sp.]|nr:UDP-glucose 4-epimerase GalE [Crocosphaera sp.]
MLVNQKKILVTGGAGYIGSHAVLALKNAGYDVIILDNLIYGHRDLVERVLKVELVIGDLGDRSLLDDLFSRYSIDAVMHFAAFAYVGESIKEPKKYYRNNVANTLTLLEAMKAASINKLVFSSTCATYGVAQFSPITEDHPQNPINPYGASKLMVEQILKDFSCAYDLNYVIFRYFNAAGAHPDGLLGEDHDPEPHLIPLVLFTALGKRKFISIFGTDYPTRDGTCIRDYIHVLDIAQAHLLGLNYLQQGGKSDIFNLGNSNGFSIQEVIDTAIKVTQKDINVQIGDRRPGDPPILVGSGEKATKILGWKPQYSSLESILSHAWQWHQKRHNE